MIEGKTIFSAIPSSVKRLLAGKEIEIDNQKLNLNSQLLLKFFYKITGNKINKTIDDYQICSVGSTSILA